MVISGFGSRVSDSVWRSLAAAGSRTCIEAGETVLRQGDPGTHVVLVLKGCVKIVRTDPQGHELLLGLRAGGDIIGEFAVLSRGTRSSAAIAIERCEASLVAAPRFRQLVDRLDLRDALYLNMLDRLRETEESHGELVQLAPPERVARCIARLVSVGGTRLRLTQDDLAKATGLARSTLAAELGHLRRKGVIETGYGCLSVSRPDLLASWPGSHG